MANETSKKLEVIKYSFAGEEISIATIPFYSEDIEEKIQKKQVRMCIYKQHFL